MIPLSTIKDRQRKVRQLADKLMYLDKKHDDDIIVSTLNFYGYGQHIFKINCRHNLLFEQKIEAIWDPMKSEWHFFDAESGNRINKSITKIFGDFVRKCKKRRIR